MGKININDLEHYVRDNTQSKPREKTHFFSLKEDKDVAQIRFCHNDLQDIEAVTLHSVKDEQGNSRKVACLRNYDDPIDKCPFCKYNSEHPEDKKIGPTQLRFFLSLVEYSLDSDNKVTYTKKVWERGKNFKKELEGLIKRYNPLCKQVFEIERQGASGDTSTKYGIYPIPGELEQFPLIKADLTNASVIGNVVANRTAEDMNRFIETGSFLQNRTATQSAPQTSNETTNVDTTQITRRRL